MAMEDAPRGAGPRSHHRQQPCARADIENPHARRARRRARWRAGAVAAPTAPLVSEIWPRYGRDMAEIYLAALLVARRAREARRGMQSLVGDYSAACNHQSAIIQPHAITNRLAWSHIAPEKPAWHSQHMPPSQPPTLQQPATQLALRSPPPYWNSRGAWQLPLPRCMHITYWLHARY